MIADAAYLVALAASSIWFGMAFRYFWFKADSAARVMVAKSHRDTPIFETYTAGVKFLGGFNAAFTLMAVVLFVFGAADSDLFARAGERATVLLVRGVAHASQFAGNVPVLRGGERRADGAFWPVRQGPMRTIFVVDGLQTVLHVVAAALVLWA
ncbi:MAG: hypothetical protein AAGE98_18475 [Actinomycetota bacterium]